MLARFFTKPVFQTIPPPVPHLQHITELRRAGHVRIEGKKPLLQLQEPYKSKDLVTPGLLPPYVLVLYDHVQ